MARVRPQRTGDGATITSRDNVVTQTYDQTYIVQLDPDEAHFSNAQVAILPGVPRPGRSMYSPAPGLIIPFCLCESVRPQSTRNRNVRTVVAKFMLEGSEPQEPTDESTDPLSLAPRVESFCESTETIMVEDYDGRQIVDPFGDFYEDPVLTEIPLPGVRLTRYVQDFDEQTLAYWKHTTNDSEWRGQPEDAWMIREVTGDRVQHGNFEVGRLQFTIVSHPLEIEYRRDGQQNRVRRRYGWQEIRAAQSSRFAAADGSIHTFHDASGSPKKLWLKHDTGRPNFAEGAMAPDFETVPEYDIYRIRRQRDFSRLA